MTSFFVNIVSNKLISLYTLNNWSNISRAWTDKDKDRDWAGTSKQTPKLRVIYMSDKIGSISQSTAFSKLNFVTNIPALKTYSHWQRLLAKMSAISPTFCPPYLPWPHFTNRNDLICVALPKEGRASRGGVIASQYRWSFCQQTLVSNTGENISDIAGIWAKNFSNVNMALTCLILLLSCFHYFQ